MISGNPVVQLQTASAKDTLLKNLEKLVNSAKPFAYAIVALALVVLGIMLIAGGENGREKAKSWAPAICIGSLCITGALTIGKWVTNIFNFG